MQVCGYAYLSYKDMKIGGCEDANECDACDEVRDLILSPRQSDSSRMQSKKPEQKHQIHK